MNGNKHNHEFMNHGPVALYVNPVILVDPSNQTTNTATAHMFSWDPQAGWLVPE